MSDDQTVLVRREGTEGLSTKAYATELRQALAETDFTVRRAATPHAEQSAISEATVVTGNSIDEALLREASALELFACTYAGTDHLPMATLRENGVTVTNASGIHAPGIAEQVLAFLLSFTRGLPTASDHQTEGRWQHYPTRELQGSTVCIIGLGAIGTAVADRLDPFGVETIGIRRNPSKGGATEEVHGFSMQAVHDCFSRSEYVVLCCPLTDETHHLINQETIGTLEPDSVVVNVGRGGLIDTDALTGALQTEQLRGAALDVTEPEPLPSDHPLWDSSRCLITPHTGGHTPKHWERLASIVAYNVRVLEGSESELRNVVSHNEDRK